MEDAFSLSAFFVSEINFVAVNPSPIEEKMRKLSMVDFTIPNSPYCCTVINLANTTDAIKYNSLDNSNPKDSQNAPARTFFKKAVSLVNLLVMVEKGIL
jgi:hypothetical protein